MTTDPVIAQMDVVQAELDELRALYDRCHAEAVLGLATTTPLQASAAAIAIYAQGIADQTCRPEDIPAQDREAVQEALVCRYRRKGGGAGR